MKRKQVLSCLLFVLMLSAVIVFAGCGDDDDPSSDGDNADGDDPDGDDPDGDDPDGDDPDGDDPDGDDPDGDDPDGDDPLVCDDDLSDGGFGGMAAAGCDTVQGICENAVTVGNNEWYPCTDDPDCCCYDEPFDGVDDVYPCQYDSCTQDGYCDENCGVVDDPDCD